MLASMAYQSDILRVCDASWSERPSPTPTLSVPPANPMDPYHSAPFSLFHTLALNIAVNITNFKLADIHIRSMYTEPALDITSIGVSGQSDLILISSPVARSAS